MLPACAVVGLERRRRLWLPLPFFLLWPLWLVGWVVWLALWALRRPSRERLRLFLKGSARLSGLRLHFETGSGQKIHVLMI